MLYTGRLPVGDHRSPYKQRPVIGILLVGLAVGRACDALQLRITAGANGRLYSNTFTGQSLGCE